MIEKDKKLGLSGKLSEADEQLLRDFFVSQRQQVADEGFSDRVMASLPTNKAWRLARLWTWICIAVGGLVLVLGNGWQHLQDCLVAFRLQGQLSLAHWVGRLSDCVPTTSTLLMMLAGFGVLLFVWGYDEVMDS